MAILPPDHGTPIDAGGQRPRPNVYDRVNSAPVGTRTPGVAPPGRTMMPVLQTNTPRPGATVKPLPSAPPSWLVNRDRANRNIAQQKEAQRRSKLKNYRNPFA